VGAVVRCAVLLWLAAALAAAASCSSGPAETAGRPAATTSRATTTPARSTSRSPAPTTTAATTTPADAGGALPGDLTPNVVEDECLLSAAEFAALTGRAAVRAENTELAGGGGRRSCFYTPEGADDPAARIDVYASASLPPPELVARIAANGGRALPGVGRGAALVSGQGGAVELVVASATLLTVLTVLPSGAVAAPPDAAWVAAGNAMAAHLTP
jgi:hypothetical protein